MAAAIFLSATGSGMGVLILLLCAWILVLICIQTYDFLKCRAHLSELQFIMDHLDEKYLFTECIPKAGNLYERYLFTLTKQAGRSMIRAVSDARAANREYREYVESFVHEIKAPITAARLISRHVEPETGRKLIKELSQIEAHVERALFYARLESPEKDFLVRQSSPAVIVANAIERYRSLLIQSGFRIETDNLEQTVYTDEKWAEPFRITGSVFLRMNCPAFSKEDLPEAMDAVWGVQRVWVCIFAVSFRPVWKQNCRFFLKKERARRLWLFSRPEMQSLVPERPFK